MFNKLSRLVLFSLLFLTPLIFWTLTPNYFGTIKDTFLLITTATLLIIYSVRLFQTKSLVLPHSLLTIPLLAFFASIVLGLILTPEGRAEALSGKAATLLILPILSIYILTLKNKAKLISTASLAILLSSGLLALHSLLQLTFLHSLTSLPLFMQSTSFTPTGSFLTTLTILLIGVGMAISHIKNPSPLLNKYFLFGVLLVNTIASVAIISLMLPGGSLALNLIPYIDTWSITLDALKSTRTLFVGIGLANFSPLYTSVKPLTINLTPLWNSLPQSGSSELLTILATTGITGTISLVYLMIKGFFGSSSSPLTLPIILTILALILTPGSLPIYLIFFTLLAINSESNPTSNSIPERGGQILALILIIIITTTTIYQGRSYIAEYYMRRAQIALTANDGKLVYENHVAAIKFAPKITNYHLSLADVNLNIASALSQKSDLSDTDRGNISNLVQQSIQEAKTATSLRPNYSGAWVALAKIYRNLIGVADGADQFAIQAYAQAITLDPANPALRIEYGGLFYQLAMNQKKTEDRNPLLSRAVQEFQMAIKLKKDYANGYYNLAKSLELAESYTEAVATMQQVVAYTNPESSDYQKAVAELEVLKTKLPKTTKQPETPKQIEAQPSELVTPSPLPSPISGGPIEIPVTETPAP